MAKHESSANSAPPRVEVFYEVELGGVTERKQLPFVIGILADLAGHPVEPPAKLKDRKFVQVDADNFDSFMARIAPRLAFSVADRLNSQGSELAVEIRFLGMSDFEPASVAAQVPALRALLDLRTRLNDLHATVHANGRLDDVIKDAALTRAGGADEADPLSAIEQIVNQGYFGLFAEDKARASEMLRIFFSELEEGRIVLSPTTGAMLSERIARIDEQLSAQLNEVFHHPEFQRLEASWRGLERLIRESELWFSLQK